MRTKKEIIVRLECIEQQHNHSSGTVNYFVLSSAIEQLKWVINDD